MIPAIALVIYLFLTLLVMLSSLYSTTKNEGASATSIFMIGAIAVLGGIGFVSLVMNFSAVAAAMEF